MGLGKLLLELFFPSKCPFCRKLLENPEDPVCPECQAELPWLLGPEAERQLEWITLCASPLRYRQRVRESLLRYKFSGLSAYARSYGQLCAQCVQDHLEGRYDLITWVPVSRKRLKQRGYDQAFLLARETAARLGQKETALLRKSRDNPRQSGIQEDAQRRANVRGVYEVLQPELVQGRRILLVDDILTTGSTLSECALTLRAAGAGEVFAVTLARSR